MGGVTEVGLAAALSDAIGSEAIGTIAAGAIEGAGIGGIGSAITGGNVLQGAEMGGLTGGALGAAPSIGAALDVGTTAADVGVGAGAGAIGSALTGGNILTGAAEGGLSGGIASQLGGGNSSSSSGGGNSSGTSSVPSGTGAAAAGSGGAGGSAASTAAPVGASGGDPSFSDAVTNLQNDGSGNIVTPTGGGATPAGNSPGTALANASTWGQTLGATEDLSPSLASAANAAAATPAPTPPPTSSGGFLSNILGKNASPLGVGISGVGLIGNAIESQKQTKGESQIEQQAANDASQGAQLQSYLQSGQLPPGLQAGITQASDAAKATIRSHYASMGMSGSSSEQQELAQVDQNAQVQSSQIAMQLLQTGITESGSAAQLYEEIMKNTLDKDKNLGSAISNFAGAASGGGAGRTIQLEA